MKVTIPLPRYGRVTVGLHRSFHFYYLEVGYTHFAKCKGVVSRFRNTEKQAVFADFDTGPESQAGASEPRSLGEIESDLAQGASNISGLGSFFIFESSPQHYHAIDFSLQDLQTTKRFLSGLRYIDYKYVAGLMKKGENTMRISEKKNGRAHRPIRFVKFLERDHSSLVHHNGLLQLYEKLHPEIRRHSEGMARDRSGIEDLYLLDYKTIVW
ncbi:MAG: hypothetical protein HY296_05120 [Thaumarchaeota archaeon]|nr:hypothetical protein [Nitrososphaerota archaeon]